MSWIPLWLAAICWTSPESATLTQDLIASRGTHRPEVTLHVSEIPAPRAAGILAGLVDHVFYESFSVEHTTINDLEADDLSTLFEDVDRSWGHRARQNAANVCMMPS